MLPTFFQIVATTDVFIAKSHADVARFSGRFAVCVFPNSFDDDVLRVFQNVTNS